MSQLGKNKPTARPTITHSSGMPRLEGSVGRSVSSRSRRGAGAAGARGSRGCRGARSIAALASWALESEAGNWGGDVGGAKGGLGQSPVRRLLPCPPHLALAGYGEAGTSGCPRTSRRARSPPWDYNSRQVLLQGRGPRGSRRRGPRIRDHPCSLLRVPLGFRGASRHFTKPGRSDALMYASAGGVRGGSRGHTASPPPAGPHPKG